MVLRLQAMGEADHTQLRDAVHANEGFYDPDVPARYDPAVLGPNGEKASAAWRTLDDTVGVVARDEMLPEQEGREASRKPWDSWDSAAGPLFDSVFSAHPWASCQSAGLSPVAGALLGAYVAVACTISKCSYIYLYVLINNDA